jgi:hypothetical protein
MKKALLAVGVGVAALVGIAGAVDVTVTNYLGTGYVMVSATCTNAGETGLATNTAYACIPLSVLSGTTELNAGTSETGDVRQVTVAFLERIYSRQQELATTNRSARMKLLKNVGFIGGNTNRTIFVVESSTVISGQTVAAE